MCHANHEKQEMTYNQMNGTYNQEKIRTPMNTWEY